MKRALGLSLLAALVATLVPAATTIAAQQKTKATVYSPFRANGKSKLAHLTKARGHCWTGSISTQRRDAWRCTVGNEIADPCFSVSAKSSSVVCPQGPWSHKGLEIELEKPLPIHSGNHAKPSVKLEPWALLLADGKRCMIATGATTAIEGHRLDYFCVNDRGGGLWGLPNRKSQPWTILTGSDHAKHLRHRVAIKRAWT